jgi:hypothetical protein
MSMRDSDFRFPGSFGFHGSNKSGPKARQAMPKAKAGPATPTAEMHRGGRSIEFHPDGRIMVHHGGGMDGHDSSELAHRQNFAKGGHVEAKESAADEREDKKLVKKGVAQHEDQLHGGKRATLKLAFGGSVKGGRNRVRPTEKGGALSQVSALNRDIENPQETETRPSGELLPAGNEPYGVEPSDEPEAAGSRQDIPQLGKGGKVKRYAKGGTVKHYADGGTADSPEVTKAGTDYKAAVDRVGYVTQQTNDPGQKAAAQSAMDAASARLTAARAAQAKPAPAAGRAKGGKVAAKKSTARQVY